MRIDIITIFPEMFRGPFDESIVKRAREKGIVKINIHDLRNYTHDKHRTVDDRPFGGGAGMVFKIEPLAEAIEDIAEENSQLILTTPDGEIFNQQIAKELAKCPHLVIICGHYEGVDERVRQLFRMRELSIGDYVLTGGELPAMVIVDAVVRLLPGVLGDEESARQDSFYNGILDYPHYTRPREFRGLEVPPVLLSGDHERIRLWRRREALKRTLMRRPDLLEKAKLSEEDKRLLDEIKREVGDKIGE